LGWVLSRGFFGGLAAAFSTGEGFVPAPGFGDATVLGALEDDGFVGALGTAVFEAALPLVPDFDATVFFATVFLGATFAAAAFFGACFLAALFFGAAFRAGAFLGAVFDAALFLGAVFFPAALVPAAFLGAAAFFATDFFAADDLDALFLAAVAPFDPSRGEVDRAVALLLPPACRPEGVFLGALMGGGR
jgi:hypothetical protein